MFLIYEELAELTGYKRPSDQRKWLNDRRWAFEVSANGRNCVLLEEVRLRMLSGAPNHDSSSELDLSVLRELS